MPHIDLATHVRTVGLFITLLNQLLALNGVSPLPFDSEQLEMTVSSILFGIAALIAWWKDNDLTKFARKRKKAGTDAMMND